MIKNSISLNISFDPAKNKAEQFNIQVENSTTLPQPINPTEVEGIEAIVNDVATTMQTLLDQIRMWQNKP